MGGAVGIGNLLRYPSIVARHYGLQWFIPYTVALLIIGIPILALEICLGQAMRGGAVIAFGPFRCLGSSRSSNINMQIQRCYFANRFSGICSCSGFLRNRLSVVGLLAFTVGMPAGIAVLLPTLILGTCTAAVIVKKPEVRGPRVGTSNSQVLCGCWQLILVICWRLILTLSLLLETDGACPRFGHHCYDGLPLLFLFIYLVLDMMSGSQNRRMIPYNSSVLSYRISECWGLS